MPILDSSYSATNKDRMSKIWTNGDTIIDGLKGQECLFFFKIISYLKQFEQRKICIQFSRYFLFFHGQLSCIKGTFQMPNFTASDESDVAFWHPIFNVIDFISMLHLFQVAAFGCKAFALLFDDIDPELSFSDKSAFQSSACAQVSITNEVYEHLGQPEFYFCPTGKVLILKYTDDHY